MKNPIFGATLIFLASFHLGNVGSATLSLPFVDLLNSYDSTARPTMRDPVTINVTLVIQTLDVDEPNQMLIISGILKQEWYDYNLRFSSTHVGHQYSIGLEGPRGERIKERIWLPDLTLSEALPPSTPTPDHRDFLRINNDGTLVWLQNILFKIPCDFDFLEYPLGELECEVKLHSNYEYDEVDYRWAIDDPVDYEMAFMSNHYEIEDVETTSGTVTSSLGKSRQLIAEFIFEHVNGWMVKQTVLPLIFAMATAYLAFFITPSGITARMVVCSVGLLIAYATFKSTTEKGPHVSYSTALEVFMGTCVTFIWFAIAESVIVDYLNRTAYVKTKEVANHHNFNSESSERLNPEDVESRERTIAHWLDWIFRILYPVLFLAFNTVYWLVY